MNRIMVLIMLLSLVASLGVSSCKSIHRGKGGATTTAMSEEPAVNADWEQPSSRQPDSLPPSVAPTAPDPIRSTAEDFKNMCALYPTHCATIAASASACSRWAERGDDSNTLRHQCWTCVMTVIIGDPEIAKGIADIHEGGTTDLTDAGERSDSYIDEANNRIGCRIGTDLLERWEWWWGAKTTGALSYCTKEIMQRRPIMPR